MCMGNFAKQNYLNLVQGLENPSVVSTVISRHLMIERFECFQGC